MFVPSQRLLWITGLIVTPLALILGLAGVGFEVIALIGALFVVLSMLDAVGSLSLMRGLKVTLPDMVRTSKSKIFDLLATIQDAAKGCTTLDLGIAFPPDLEVDSVQISTPLHLGAGSDAVAWKVLAAERGVYRLPMVYLQTPSRLGLWDMRRAMPVSCEIRVYPDLSREKHILAPLFFRRGNLGSHQIRQLGKGREFEQLRSYQPGDSFNDIYWKGTAKRRFPVTMMHQIERTQELHVVLDISRRSARPLDSMSRGVDEKVDRFAPQTQCERFIQAALILALAAEQQGDRFGMMVFSDQVHTILPVGGGRSHYNACRDILYTLQPRIVSPDFSELFVQVGNRLRHRALVIILTDLAEPWLSESFTQAVQQASKRHVVLVHTLGSREFQPLFQRGSSIGHADELYIRMAGHLMWVDLQSTTRQLKQCGIHLTSSLQENLIADVVTEYLNVKRRQIL